MWPSSSSKAPTLAYVWHATTGALRRCLTMKCIPFDSVNSLMVPSSRVSRSALPPSAASTAPPQYTERLGAFKPSCIEPHRCT